MARFMAIAMWAAWASTLACGGHIFIGFVSNPGGASSITGVVTAVSGGFIKDNNGFTQYTSVTFLNTGTEITVNFCGDQVQLFPLDVRVRADYTAGIVCSVLIRVVVDSEPTRSRRTALPQSRTLPTVQSPYGP